MAALHKAWDEGRTTIFAFDAMGGAGKTALVYHFVQALKASGWRGAQSVFAWSFYSQGSNEDRQTSADDFFKAAFKHFGGKDSAPPRDPREKGVDLAHLVQAQRALLILDGLEPLQYVARGGGRMDDAKAGGVKDPGIKALLGLLADHNPGLCLVTTRIRLAELAGNTGFAFEELKHLPLMAGIELLRDLGVEPNFPPPVAPEMRSIIRGLQRAGGQMPDSPAGFRHDGYALPQRAEFAALVPPYTPPPEYAPPPADARPAMPPQIAKDLIAAVEELQGHALALTLVGNYLAEHHHGDVRAIHDVPALAELRDAPERSPYRVMRAIEIALARRIEEEGKTEKPAETVAGRELALLFFLGLFDRPAEMAHLPVVFPEDAAQVLQPDAADLALSSKNLIPIKKRLHELKQELLTDLPDWRKEEIAQEERVLVAERDEALEAKRRVLLRRAFTGMAQVARDRHQLTEALQELTRRGLLSSSRGAERDVAIQGDPGLRRSARNDATHENAGFDKGSVDCHPLVREYFGARLKELDRETFKASHGRMYDHYRYANLPAAFRNPVAYGVLALKAAFECDHYPMLRRGFLDGSLSGDLRSQVPPSIAKKQPTELRAAFELVDGSDWPDAKAAFLPEDEAGMTPLFAAITHGCAAEREDETFTEVYWPRIARGNEDFAARKLGLFGQALAALAAFFEMPFTKPSWRLSPGIKALTLNIAGFHLRALGRLEDAAEPMRASVSFHIKQEKWENASVESGNLSELLLTIGRIAGEDGAVAAAEEAVTFADRSGDAFQRIVLRTTHADALAQAGRLARSEALYREAEALQKERRPNLPRLCALEGFRYCDLLLARGRAAGTTARAEYMIARSVADAMTPTLTVALEIMTQARAVLAEAPLSAPAPGDCAELSKQALAALHRANEEIWLARGLLAHAEALLRCGDAKAADDPLREAETIAARGPMPLFMTQAHLLRARIALSQNNLPAAKRKRDAALELIQRHGYGRAAPEAAVLDAEIACAENAANRDAAIADAVTAIRGEPYHDERTGITIDGGWWGLYPRLELLLPAGDPRLADLRVARDAYNAERDAYLRSTLASDVEGYHPADDPIAAYLGVDVWEEEDRALADPDFRRELSEALVRSGYKPLDETPSRSTPRRCAPIPQTKARGGKPRGSARPARNPR